LGAPASLPASFTELDLAGKDAGRSQALPPLTGYSLRFCARRLASSRRLVVLGGGSPGGLGAALAATASGSGAADSVSLPGKGIVEIRSGRNSSGLGSRAGAVCFERSTSPCANRATSDS